MALGVLVMVVSVSVLHGFQREITDKVAGFGSHLTIRAFDVNPMYAGEAPLHVDSALVATLEGVKGVKHVQSFATKGGMVKTEDQIYGVVLRGLSPNYDTSFYSTCLTAGHLPQGNNEVLVSTTIAARLRLQVGSKMRTYFWQGEGYRQRAFTIVGLYNTDLTEMDERYVVGTLGAVQRLNDWGDTLVGGYEVLTEDFRQLEATQARVLEVLPYDITVQSIVEANPALFSWLDLLNSNITLILAIMCLVSAVAIVSALLIMIFEKSSTIGLLKALGATGQSVRRIFMLKATGLVLKGILIGDAIALTLCLVQAKWQPLRLDPESYSMTHVPVSLDVWTYVAISLGVALVCLVALLLPATYISRISPAKTMRTAQ